MKCRYKHDIKKNEIVSEVEKEMRASLEKRSIDIDTMILWTLHKEFGFGKKRLKRFFLRCIKDFNYSRERYDMNDAYPLRVKLKEECGVDVVEWYKEIGI